MSEYYAVHRRSGALRKKPYEVREVFSEDEFARGVTIFKGTLEQCADMAYLLNWARQQREKAEVET